VPKVLSNLVTLRVKGCPDAVQQLIAGMTSCSRASSNNSSHQPPAALGSLQVLDVEEAGDLSVCLPVLLSHCGWPVAEQLQQLCLSRVDVAFCKQQLPQLPALQELQLTECGLQYLPAWVEGNCSRLSKLVLSNNVFQQLPAAITRLTTLKVSNM
jgi:hypothetical protein